MPSVDVYFSSSTVGYSRLWQSMKASIALRALERSALRDGFFCGGDDQHWRGQRKVCFLPSVTLRILHDCDRPPLHFGAAPD